MNKPRYKFYSSADLVELGKLINKDHEYNLIMLDPILVPDQEGGHVQFYAAVEKNDVIVNERD